MDPILNTFTGWRELRQERRDEIVAQLVVMFHPVAPRIYIEEAKAAERRYFAQATEFTEYLQNVGDFVHRLGRNSRQG
ncbi:unnamed protein product [Caenorhabditis nigoni]|uniref:Mediator complex subunit 15 KIX domain-containing protein n=1 Tax=Caenorhabditis nigoni TaxID=1611254 RepID=A0A2G5SSG3_9PELO|nr:hypothetical protein B9Z55_024047 [Caenorhabditis nigoni]